jgi:hypothetical protein
VFASSPQSFVTQQTQYNFYFPDGGCPSPTEIGLGVSNQLARLDAFFVIFQLVLSYATQHLWHRASRSVLPSLVAICVPVRWRSPAYTAERRTRTHTLTRRTHARLHRRTHILRHLILPELCVRTFPAPKPKPYVMSLFTKALRASAPFLISHNLLTIALTIMYTSSSSASSSSSSSSSSSLSSAQWH